MERKYEVLNVAWSDVVGVFQSVKWYLAAIVAIVVVAAVVAVAVRKVNPASRKLVRSNAVIIPAVAIVAVVSMMLTGPISTLLDLAVSGGKNAKVSDATTAKASDVARDIAGEGFVLLKNDAGLLPLKNTRKLNLFGWACENPVYGGTGSGAINANYQVESLEKGLHKAGFKTNSNLADIYRKVGARDTSNQIAGAGWSLPEATRDVYTDQVMEQAKRFSDTAVITLARVGGEGYDDMPTDMSKVKHDDNSKAYKDFQPGESYLQPSRTEKDMIDVVCRNFDKVIFLYNGSNPMELGFLNQYRQIRSALWTPAPGNVGFDALGDILTGKIDPSGRTNDTFLYDMSKAPWWNNAAATKYTNMKKYALHLPVAKGLTFDLAPSFTDYVEGIYVGYRYYETAAQEGLIDYDGTVQYPFGYGLSYTNFRQKMGRVTKDGNDLTFNVDVTNTGKASGKDTVEVYSDPPYTNGGIEKASANLLKAAKTRILKPGESQSVKISFPITQLASYDEKDAKAYVLEKGDYQIAVKSDSHHVLDSTIYTVDSTVTYGKGNPRPGDRQAATDKISDIAGDVTYLSRKDHFANHDAAVAAPTSDVLPAKYVKQYHVNRNFDNATYDNPKDRMPVTGAKNGIKLKDLRGLSADDPKWDKLLDELSVDDMTKLTSLGGFQTSAIDSIGKVATTDVDGPASLNNNFTKQGSIGFPIAVVLANTWNSGLARRYGEIMGQMAREMGVTGWYAPAMNTHRTAIGGRNFEYYSEDGEIAGEISENVVSGARSKGVYAYIKHFALYDSNAMMVSVWSNEQAAREVYLRPFEMSVKNGKADACMAAWAFIGTKWSGEQGWINSIMRDEWGFDGMVITDSFGEDGRGFMNADNAFPNGVDMMLSTYGKGPNVVKDRKSPSSVKYLRNASRHILYTTVNSGAYDSDSEAMRTPVWKVALIVVDVFIALILAGVEIVAVRRFIRRRGKDAGTATA